MVFVVAVLLRPEVQTMAQKELDAVTRRERLPEFEDRLKLPFVDAICKEVIRWKPVAPLGKYYSAIPNAKDMTIHRHTPCNIRR
jgi:cytochrome P450